VLKARVSSRSAPLAALCLAIALGSCGTKAPSLATVECRVDNRPLPGEEGSYESLSVFGCVRGDDGLDSLSELWITNDDAALAWKLDGGDWTKVKEGGDTWIGATALASPDFKTLPRGDYKLILVDLAGQRAEKGFSMAEESPKKEAPALSRSGNAFSIVSAWPENLVLGFDAAGTLIASPGAAGGTRSLASVFGQEIAGRVATVGAYGYDPSLRAGAYSRRISAR
jgi:hypothetical protein